MRKFIGILAVGGMLAVASSAWGAIVYTPVPLDPLSNTIGIINPYVTQSLNTMYVTGDDAEQSDNIVVTFGFNVYYGVTGSFSSFYYWLQQFVFLYDSSSLEVVHAQPAGPWAGARSNYGSLTDIWPNPSSGITGLLALHGYYTTTYPTGQLITPTTYVTVFQQDVVPFFQVTLHVKSAQNSQVNIFGISMMTAVSKFAGSTLTPALWDYYGGAVHEVPEPSSLALLGGGFALFGGWVVRRRRRAA